MWWAATRSAFKKRLSTPNEQGKPVKVMEFDNPREEYVKIAAF